MIVNRSTYTNIYRDQRYWNRNTFNQKYGKIPIPLCPNDLSGIQSGIQSGINSLESGIQSGLTSAAQGIASGAQAVAGAAQGMSTPAPAN